MESLDLKRGYGYGANIKLSAIERKIKMSRCLPFLKTVTYIILISEWVRKKSTKSTILNFGKLNYKPTLKPKSQLRPYVHNSNPL